MKITKDIKKIILAIGMLCSAFLIFVLVVPIPKEQEDIFSEIDESEYVYVESLEDLEDIYPEYYAEESPDTMDEITTEKLEFINKFENIFESSGVPYEMSPNESIIFGTETNYTILDSNYPIFEMISSVYDANANVIDEQINIVFTFHLEKGIDKNNPHVKLIYEVLHKFGMYPDIDAMISSMSINESSDADEPPVNIKWTKTGRNNRGYITVAYHNTTPCNYSEELNYSEFSSLDDREVKSKEYYSLHEERLAANGYPDEYLVDVFVDDGWKCDSYEDVFSNNLGKILCFSDISTSPETINDAVNIVKIYIDTINELFPHNNSVSSEAIAKDIVTRAMIKRYSDESILVRLYNDAEHDKMDFPCQELFECEFSPIYAIQYLQSGYYENVSKTAKELGFDRTLRPDYYVPVKVEGLQNK